MSPPLGRSVGTIALLGLGYTLYAHAYGSAAGLALISSVAFISIKSALPEKRLTPSRLTRSVSAPGALSSFLEPPKVRSLDSFQLPELSSIWLRYEEPPPPEPLVLKAIEEVAAPRGSTISEWWSSIRSMVDRAKGFKNKILYLRNKRVNWREQFGNLLEIGEIDGALERTAMRGGEWTVMTNSSAAAEELLVDWGQKGGASIKMILVGSPRNLRFSKGWLKRVDLRILGGRFSHRSELIDALEEGGQLRYIFRPDNTEEIEKCRAQSPSSEEERPNELHLIFSR